VPLRHGLLEVKSYRAPALCPISLNWAGVPLRSFETTARYIAGTTTATGLRVRAVLKRGGNETGERVSAHEWLRLRLRMKSHAVCPQWNYTLRPQPCRR
jgi:hypothetical protein